MTSLLSPPTTRTRRLVARSGVVRTRPQQHVPLGGIALRRQLVG
ncbi:MAG: hypothetical protein VW877_01325 [Pseudomonadaceae bacterium]